MIDDNKDDDAMRVYFSISNLGQTNSMTYECEYDTTWDEVLDKVIRTMEAHYGYSFNMNESGIYHSDKS